MKVNTERTLSDGESKSKFAERVPLGTVTFPRYFFRQTISRPCTHWHVVDFQYSIEKHMDNISEASNRVFKDGYP